MAGKSQRPESPFDITADVQQTRAGQLRQLLDVWVVAPFRVMWTDTRTKIGLLVVMFYVFIGTLGVVIVPPPQLQAGPVFAPPFQDLQFPLGTDKFGQGILASLIHATPPMLKMILSGSVFTVTVATMIGTVSGYKGGVTDQVLMTITDIMLTIPGLPLVIVIAIALDPRNPFVIGIILSINAWAGLARSLRSQVLAIREDAYVEASKVMGVPTPRIVVADILPNLMPYIMVNFMQSARNVIFASVGLYYLGLLPFTTLNWGVMMNMAQAAGALRSDKVIWWLLFPMLTITFLTFGLIALAQGMDRVFNPRVRARHAKTLETDEAETA
jgi:peptide/nickel transport system permease protein